MAGGGLASSVANTTNQAVGQTPPTQPQVQPQPMNHSIGPGHPLYTGFGGDNGNFGGWGGWGGFHGLGGFGGQNGLGALGSGGPGSIGGGLGGMGGGAPQPMGPGFNPNVQQTNTSGPQLGMPITSTANQAQLTQNQMQSGQPQPMPLPGNNPQGLGILGLNNQMQQPQGGVSSPAANVQNTLSKFGGWFK